MSWIDTPSNANNDRNENDNSTTGNTNANSNNDFDVWDAATVAMCITTTAEGLDELFEKLSIDNPNIFLPNAVTAVYANRRQYDLLNQCAVKLNVSKNGCC